METLNEQLGLYRRNIHKFKKAPWVGKVEFKHIEKLDFGWNKYDIVKFTNGSPESDRLTTIQEKLVFIDGKTAKTKGTLKELLREEITEDYSIPRFQRGIVTGQKSQNLIVKKLLEGGTPKEIQSTERGLPVFYKNQIVGLEGCPGGGKSTKCADIIELLTDKYKIFYFTPTHEQVNNMAKKLKNKYLSLRIMSDESKLENTLTSYHTSNQKGYNPLKKNSIPGNSKIISSTTN